MLLFDFLLGLVVIASDVRAMMPGMRMGQPMDPMGMQPGMMGQPGLNPMAMMGGQQGMTALAGGLAGKVLAGPMAQAQALAGMLSPEALKAQGVAMAKASAQLMIPGVSSIIARTADMGSAMYERKTQGPMIWIKLRKSPQIIVDREFYNISTVPGMVAMANMTKMVLPKPPPPRGPKPAPPLLADIRLKRGAFIERALQGQSFLEQKLKVDPQMIQNGLYLSMPLRQPAQESINIAVAEDTRTIQAEADYRRKDREVKRLNNRFNDVLRQFTRRALG
jgi:hypothetical protein